MKVKSHIGLIVLLCSIAYAPDIYADTYGTFQTTKYYAANHRYLVIVTKKKRATLYLQGRKLHRLLPRILTDLPNQLLVTNDGERVVIIDRYYGNNGSPETPVVIILDKNGKEIATHRLGDLSNLNRVLQTTSSAHWYKQANISSDGQILVIETQVRKYTWDECHNNTQPDQMEKCWETIPYQQLRFFLATGELVEKVGLTSQ